MGRKVREDQLKKHDLQDKLVKMGPKTQQRVPALASELDGLGCDRASMGVSKIYRV